MTLLRMGPALPTAEQPSYPDGRQGRTWRGLCSVTGQVLWAGQAPPLASPEMPIRATRPGEEELAGLCAELRDRPLTYDQVGGTRGSRLPDGYHHDRARVDIGYGAEGWVKAQDALRTWQGYAGASITPSEAPLECGTVVIATAKAGPLFVVAPCRIVYATLDTDRFGFAYGTLPGHPERGEEAFHVARSAETLLPSRSWPSLVRLQSWPGSGPNSPNGPAAHDTRLPRRCPNVRRPKRLTGSNEPMVPAAPGNRVLRSRSGLLQTTTHRGGAYACAFRRRSAEPCRIRR